MWKFERNIDLSQDWEPLVGELKFAVLSMQTISKFLNVCGDILKISKLWEFVMLDGDGGVKRELTKTNGSQSGLEKLSWPPERRNRTMAASKR